jgi:hypothetical protein
VAFVVHGIAALAIILVILLIFILGIASLMRITGRGIKKARDQL